MACGDGSDAVFEAAGKHDGMIFRVIDRDANNAPTLTSASGAHTKTSVPISDLTGSPGFCRLKRV
jgi:hypothetical protein